MKLRCQWCNKTQDGTLSLIAGPRAHICFDCVEKWCERLAENPLAGTGGDDTIKCAFCELTIFAKRFAAGDGVQICDQCLKLALLITKDEWQPTPSALEVVEPTAAAAEWSKIDHSGANDQTILRLGQKWLAKYRSEPEAGEVLVRLLQLKTSSRLLDAAEGWLTRFPSHECAPRVTAKLLKSRTTPTVAEGATSYLTSSEPSIYLYEIVRAVLDSNDHQQLYKIISARLESHPTEWLWGMALPWGGTITKRAEKITVRWIDLNRHNSAFTFGMTLYSVKSQKIIDAARKWLKGGGSVGDETPRALDLLIEACSQHHKENLPWLLNFARRWLKNNPNDHRAGGLHAAMIAGQSRPDIRRAKEWYHENQNNPTAWLVVSALLHHYKVSSLKPDTLIVNQAKNILRNEDFRSSCPVLVGRLVEAHQDFETVAWAKELFRRETLLWVLVALAEKAPDREVFELARDRQASWIGDQYYEAQLLHALLIADHSDRWIRMRARAWLRRHPRDKYRARILRLLN